MKTRELIGYARKRVRGRRRELLLVCMIPIGADLFFRLAEAALYSLLLYFGAMRPAALFTGENTEQLVIAAVFTLLRWLVTAPLFCAAAVRLKEFTDEKPLFTSFSDMLLSGRFIRRSISAFFMGRLVGAAALVPAAAAGAYAFSLISGGGGSRELFAASNAAALAIAGIALWISVRLSLTAVPFILAACPEKSAAGAVFMSFRFMRGRRGMPLKLAAAYLLPMLTIAAIPFLIPELAAALSIGMSIFMKEDEYILQEYGTAGARLAR